MSHVLIEFDPQTQTVELATDANGFIALSAGLETMAIISLFTRKRAPDEEQRDTKYGWWGDTFADIPGDLIGSHLWLLQRSNLTREALRFAQLYAFDAFAWMETIGLVSKIETSAESIDKMLALTVKLTRPDGSVWSELWKVHSHGI